MKLSDEELRKLYSKETARRVRETGAECLASEMLTLAAAGELSVPERELVADHLATCSDCVKEYRSIRSLRSWAEDASTSLAPQNVAGATPLVPFTVAHQSREGVAAFRPLASYLPYAIAALLLLITLALAAQLISQRRENQRLVAQINQGQAPRGPVTTEPDSEIRKQLEAANLRASEAEAARRNAEDELAKRSQNNDQAPTRPGRGEDQPQVNVPIFDLDPSGSSRGQTDEATTTVEVPREANLFTLILNVNGQQSGSGYSVEVLDHGGRSLANLQGLRVSPYNNFSVSLPRRSFPAGEYRLKLFRSQDGQRVLLHEYPIRLGYR
jgi:hypothetical protein